MKASEIKRQIDDLLEKLGKNDFEVVLKHDGWIYDINGAFLGHEEKGRENYEYEANVIILRASE